MEDHNLAWESESSEQQGEGAIYSIVAGSLRNLRLFWLGINIIIQLGLGLSWFRSPIKTILPDYYNKIVFGGIIIAVTLNLSARFLQRWAENSERTEQYFNSLAAGDEINRTREFMRFYSAVYRLIYIVYLAIAIVGVFLFNLGREPLVAGIFIGGAILMMLLIRPRQQSIFERISRQLSKREADRRTNPSF